MKHSGRPQGPRIPDRLITAMQKGALSRDIRQTVADHYKIHINQVAKITRGDAPFNRTNKKVIGYMMILIIGKLANERDEILKQLEYLNSDHYLSDIKLSE